MGMVAYWPAAFAVGIVLAGGCSLDREGTLSTTDTTTVGGSGGSPTSVGGSGGVIGGMGGGGAPAGGMGGGGAPMGGMGGMGGMMPVCGNGIVEGDEECDVNHVRCEDCDVVCPDNWTKAPATAPEPFHCFEQFGDGSQNSPPDQTFEDAAADCAVFANGDGHLATASSMAELMFLDAFLEDFPTFIGARDQDSMENCDIQWETPNETWSFGNNGGAPWGAGEPNICASNPCVYLQTGFIYDFFCTVPLGWACEVDNPE